MSTVLLDHGRLNVASFAGGVARGLCVQITVESDYVQLTLEEAAWLQLALTDFLEERSALKAGPRPRADEDAYPGWRE